MPTGPLSSSFGARRKAVGIQRWRLAQLLHMSEVRLGRIERTERVATSDELARIDAALAVLERTERNIQSHNAVKVA